MAAMAALSHPRIPRSCVGPHPNRDEPSRGEVAVLAKVATIMRSR
jgi:hypothetical protein